MPASMADFLVAELLREVFRYLDTDALLSSACVCPVFCGTVLHAWDEALQGMCLGVLPGQSPEWARASCVALRQGRAEYAHAPSLQAMWGIIVQGVRLLQRPMGLVVRPRELRSVFASTTDHPEFESVENTLDYGRSQRYWSSTANNCPNTTETLLYTLVEEGPVAVTHICIRPFLYIPQRLAFPWKAIQFSFGQCENIRQSPEKIVEQSKVIWTSEFYHCKNNNDPQYYEFPRGISANVIRVNLAGKYTEQVEGQGYYICVERFGVLGVNLGETDKGEHRSKIVDTVVRGLQTGYRFGKNLLS
mmetsp:Transcript_34298/g.72704  ORF Transcript_34298/g.72704 Transcript_34298/m.72704 type:complete len:304 (-) Transcript_34298:321-1232(-)